ncbi:MAG: hypothetical protein HYY49_03385 [Ignavibacteriales bacterium]|nr:hypothetical protein [Ignavibacteriales bacterium]
MNRYDLDDFELFKELFEFAYADDGLNLGYRSKAEEWARTWLEKHRDIDLAEFKRVFAFAYGESGLNLGYRSKAAEWAFKQLSKL